MEDLCTKVGYYQTAGVNGVSGGKEGRIAGMGGEEEEIDLPVPYEPSNS